jgi:hydroxymethylpyrimidine/phosphomethylpyrimidine kinase
MSSSLPVVLTIAGFDPSSGAGVTADIKAIAAHGCYGIAAITAMTVQSTAGVRRLSPVDPGLLSETLDELAADMTVSAVHIGMQGSGEIAARVAAFLERVKPQKVVLDPILKSSSGASLLDDSGISILKERLLPLATVITPNIDEATALTGIPIQSVADMKLAARRLQEMGAQSVVVTGGHLEAAIDLLCEKGQPAQTFRSHRVPSKNTHGTGCAFSTAIPGEAALLGGAGGEGLCDRGDSECLSGRKRHWPGQSHACYEEPSAGGGDGEEIGVGEGLVLRLPGIRLQ